MSYKTLHAMYTKGYFTVQQNATFTLKELVKSKMSQEQLAKKLKMSRSQVNTILSNPDTISLDRLKDILFICGYKLEFNVIQL